jgi:phosphatidylserine/phosphatidylglycerophosphate/cardiolipin synthase-like enzyme
MVPEKDARDPLGPPSRRDSVRNSYLWPRNARAPRAGSINSLRFAVAEWTFEYQPTMIHTKSMVVDSLFTIFGSSNFDSRSSEINEELDVVVYDEKFGREAEAMFEKDLRESREYTLEDFKRRSLWERTSEWLILPFRSQL